LSFASQTGFDWYPAPAKLNLFLRVLGRRADGYHLIQTLFRLIDHGDLVGIRTRADGEIRRTDPVAGVPEESDLTLRAAALLRERAIELNGPAARKLGADLSVQKRIPVGGGLGGGSSDAATVLQVLNQRWDLGLSRAELQRLGLRLGADVPFFIFGETAIGEGVGERLTAFPLDPAWYVVLVPQVPVSTKEIFSDAALTRDSKPLKLPPFLPGRFGNDLEPVVRRLYPQVAMHLEWLAGHGTARVTGSGACVFAEFDSEAAAADVLSRRPEGMQGFVARGLDHHPLRDRAKQQ
jgi:4-diphosphocytidyl-2-C-methyl-D-erythritol kinase